MGFTEGFKINFFKRKIIFGGDEIARDDSRTR